MQKTTGRPAGGSARARKRNGRDHARPGKLRARAADCKEREQTGGCALRVHITRIGSHARFFAVDQAGETVITSRLYPSPQAAKQGLIGLAMAIQADDFETFYLE